MFLRCFPSESFRRDSVTVILFTRVEPNPLAHDLSRSRLSGSRRTGCLRCVCTGRAAPTRHERPCHLERWHWGTIKTKNMREVVSFLPLPVRSQTVCGGQRDNMKSLAEMIPNPQDLFALETEELAGVLLEYISSSGIIQDDRVFRHNLTRQRDVLKDYDRQSTNQSGLR